MRNYCEAKTAGDFEMGIHCYDHIRWQDNLFSMSRKEVFHEFQKAYDIFTEIFSEKALTAGSAGWQANAFSLEAYDNANLLYGSDTRGTSPFIPQIDNTIYKTPQIPSTLPTLDELLGREEYPYEKLIPHYLSLIKPNQLNVLTIHAELEGMRHFDWFKQLIIKIKETYPDLQFVRLDRIAKNLHENLNHLPICRLEQGEIDGRSGTLALQGEVVSF